MLKVRVSIANGVEPLKSRNLSESNSAELNLSSIMLTTGLPIRTTNVGLNNNITLSTTDRNSFFQLNCVDERYA